MGQPLLLLLLVYTYIPGRGKVPGPLSWGLGSDGGKGRGEESSESDDSEKDGLIPSPHPTIK
jgi:hypothetical protein